MTLCLPGTQIVNRATEERRRMLTNGSLVLNESQAQGEVTGIGKPNAAVSILGGCQ